MAVKRTPQDDAFSKAIRESFDYTCASCNVNYRHDTGFMHCAHVHTRKHSSTRWNSNYGAVALCAKCHWRYTDFPLEWADWCRGYFGDSNYNEIKRLAWKVRKYTKAEKQEITKHYKKELSRIEKLRAEGVTGVIEIVSYD